jgi:DNA-binding MarR family transcriptional regulator
LGEEDTKLLEMINEKLDSLMLAIPLLRIMAKAKVDEVLDDVLTTSTRKRIFELCDGENSVQKIAKRAKTTKRYVNMLINELEAAGLVIVTRKGSQRYPKRVIM